MNDDFDEILSPITENQPLSVEQAIALLLLVLNPNHDSGIPHYAAPR